MHSRQCISSLVKRNNAKKSISGSEITAPTPVRLLCAYSAWSGQNRSTGVGFKSKLIFSRKRAEQEYWNGRSRRTGVGGAGGPSGRTPEYWADQSFSAHSSAPTPPGADGVGALEWASRVIWFSVVKIGWQSRSTQAGVGGVEALEVTRGWIKMCCKKKICNDIWVWLIQKWGAIQALEWAEQEYWNGRSRGTGVGGVLGGPELLRPLQCTYSAWSGRSGSTGVGSYSKWISSGVGGVGAKEQSKSING